MSVRGQLNEEITSSCVVVTVNIVCTLEIRELEKERREGGKK